MLAIDHVSCDKLLSVDGDIIIIFLCWVGEEGE